MDNYVYLLVMIIWTITSTIGEEGDDCLQVNVGLLPSIENETFYWIDHMRSYALLTPEERLTGDFWRETVSSKEGFFKESCYKHPPNNIRLKFPQRLNEVQQIDDPELVKQLSGVDVIIGEYRPAIHAYARNNSVAFLLTAPPDIEVEEQIREGEKEDERVVFSVWPSYTEFYRNSITALVRFLQIKTELGDEVRLGVLGRILFVVPANSKKIGVAHELLKQLLFSGWATWTKLITVETLTSKPANAGMVVEKEIRQSLPDMIIVFYDDASQADTLKVIDRYVALMKDHGPKLYFWDMFQYTSGVWYLLMGEDKTRNDDFFKARVVTSHFMTRPFWLRCKYVKQNIIAHTGAHDAYFILVWFILKNYVSSKAFDRKDLLNALRSGNETLRQHKLKAWESDRISKRLITDGLPIFRKGYRQAVPILIAITPKKFTYGGFSYDCGITYEYGCLVNSSRMSSNSTNIKDMIVKEWKGYERHQTYSSYVRSFDPTLRKTAGKGCSIVIVLQEPFAAERNYTSFGHSGFHGLALDLVTEAIGRMEREREEVIKCTFSAAPQNQYGSYNRVTKTWSGAMGVLQAGKANLAIGMISKTKERSRFFDYSPPFEYVGLAYLQKKTEYNRLFLNFLSPFDSTIWIGLAIVFFVSGIFVFLLEYWNPFMDEEDVNQKVTWSSAMWYSFSTVTQQGAFAPVKYATRVFSVFYWFFALVVTASYTGNLASFLTESFEVAPAYFIEELGGQAGVGMTWATLKNSYMDTFIRSGNSVELQTVAKQMMYVSDYDEGLNFVESSTPYRKQVFIGNHLLLNHLEAQSVDCTLAVSPKLAGFTELAFPMTKEWEYKQSFIRAMIAMRDERKILDILNSAIISRHCAGDDRDDTMLDLDSFKGLYAILGIFTAASFILLAFKLIGLKLMERNAKKTEKSEGDTEKSEGDIGNAEGVESTML